MTMLKLNKSCRRSDLHVLMCVVLTAIFAIGLVSTACDPHCAGYCSKHVNGCDLKCNDTWGLNFTSFRCGRCDYMCLSPCNMHGPGTCDVLCKPGYCVNKTTYKCSPALYCNRCNTSGLFPCLECMAGYSYVNEKCIPCDPNCSTNCTSPYTCPQGKCNPRYASVPVPGTSDFACGACDPQCNGTCSVAGTCDGPCNLGYALTPGKTCGACGQYCVGGCNISGPGLCDCPCASNARYDATKRNCYLCDVGCTPSPC